MDWEKSDNTSSVSVTLLQVWLVSEWHSCTAWLLEDLLLRAVGPGEARIAGAQWCCLYIELFSRWEMSLTVSQDVDTHTHTHAREYMFLLVACYIIYYYSTEANHLPSLALQSTCLVVCCISSSGGCITSLGCTVERTLNTIKQW